MIKNYQIKETLYTGIKTHTYRAVRLADNQPVVLKVLAEAYPNPLDIARLQREFDLVQKLSAAAIQGIPTFESLEKEDNRYFISMQDEGGMSLKHFFDTRQPDIATFLRIAIQICQVLTRIHEQKIIHRDLKPGNILVLPASGEVRIIDFSLSVRMAGAALESAGSSALEGSLPYISPEQTGRMNRPTDYRSDLYAFGVCCYELLSGQLPFKAAHPLEWVHAHLAQTPPDLLSLRADIPRTLANIILKLMAKMADDRYQSAYGLQKDFEQCLKQWETTGAIADFPLGAFDVQGVFRLPAKLYGRENEVRQLTETVDRVIADGRPEMLLVGGYSGMGKTVLVQEARKQIAIAKGYFIAGKFDQLNRGTPYQGFSLAFSELARQLPGESEATIGQWRSALLEALGANASIINNLIPEFEWLLGEHPAPIHLSPDESAKRFLYAWREFVKAIAQPDRPLILFLDDLQWADLASLRLIELLMADPDIQHLCLIGSYRDNETDATHPLMHTLAQVREMLPLHEIGLAPLNATDVQAMLSDIFGRHAPDLEELGRLLLEKTKGNPFFLTQSLRTLHEDGQIRFDTQQGRWMWDIQRLRDMNITENVADLMAGAIRKLSPEAQQILQHAACIGNEFSLRALSWVEAPERLPALNEAIEQGFVLTLDDRFVLLSDPEQLERYCAGHTETADIQEEIRFQFLHDRVQQAAYSLLTDEGRQKIHLKLGRRMLQTAGEREREERIFDICNHLNQSSQWMQEAAEREELAALNLQAGQKALNANAYAPAFEYLSSGISYLPVDAWKTKYPLCCELHLSLAQGQYLNGQAEAAAQTLQAMRVEMKNRLDQLRVLQVFVSMYANQGALDKVIDTVAEALLLFKVRMPRKPSSVKLGVMRDLIGLRIRLRKTQPESLLQHPFSKEPDYLALSALNTLATPSIFMASADLFAWLILNDFKLLLAKGYADASPAILFGYGMVINAAFGDFDNGFRYAETSIRLNAQNGDAYPVQKLRFTYFNFFAHQKEDIRQIMEKLPDVYRTALEMGDPEYGGFALSSRVWLGLAIGRNLEDLTREADDYLRLLRRQQNFGGHDLLFTRYQAALALSDRQAEANAGGDMAAQIEKLEAERSLAALGALYIAAYQTNVLLEQDDRLSTYWLAGEKCVEVIKQLYLYADFAIYSALASLRLVESNAISAAQALKSLKKHLNNIKPRAARHPGNYGCHYLTLQVVEAHLKGKQADIIPLLEQLAAQAEACDYPNFVALAKELTGIRYYKNKQRKIAQLYLRESLYAYQRWGASAKVRRMREQYPELLTEAAGSNIAAGGVPSYWETQSVSTASNLDLNSLMKSATAISSEIVLEKLLPGMIHIVMENAGAQSGLIILEKNQQLVISAEQAAGRNAELISDLPVAGSDKVPESLIAYVQRTRTPVVLDFAAGDTRFQQDPYIAKNKSKSVFCIPIEYKSALKGLIYLENNLISGAFTAERVGVMKILSAQIGVALDNAGLYKNLEEALEKQVVLTEAYSRFTPREYLNFLGHSSILDVRLGDHRAETMTALFSDIRSYTTLAEELSAEENFQFLSAYLQRMTSMVAQHKGMVNQMLGDGILAFFSEPENALKAAIEMQQSLHNYIVERPGKEPIQVRVGIGLHVGSVIIGVVGDEERMNAAIVSDTVNAASRIEGLTKFYGVNILLSDTLAERLSESARQRLRFVGKVKVRGKREHIGLYESFDGDPPSLQENKAAALPEYNKALDMYYQRNFPDATQIFHDLLKQNEEDAVLRFYWKKALQFNMQGVEDDWTGVETMEYK